MWAFDSVFYQIYPLGFCGAPEENRGEEPVNRIKKIGEWSDHIKELGADALYLSPIFESDRHGYDTRDYRTIDRRLGTNDDFKSVCDILHSKGIKIVLDGVFNHVGRGFFAFEDVRKNRENSPYKNWFHIDFGGNSNYNDGFWYKGWEGHYELVELNLGCEEVVRYLLDSVSFWINEFGIDGIRLDVAYCLSYEFIQRLRQHVNSLKDNFFLIGEIIHGDYNRLLNAGLDSCTNYECYKGLYSSFNSMNMFEISYSLNRQFGSEHWCLYTGKHLLNFVDNHDVSRIATALANKGHLPLIYGMMLAMPGIPCIYYGSEWGAEGDKAHGDNALRISYDSPVQNELFNSIRTMISAYKSCNSLQYGSYRNVVVTNKQLIFERKTDSERILVAVNADSEEFTAHFDAGCGRAFDVLTKTDTDFGGGLLMKPYSIAYLKCEH